MSKPSVTVIGAGIAGLTAAYRLKQDGFAVKVLEANSCAGGRMTQRQEHGLSYNTGARLCYSFYTEVQKLVSELGLQDSVIKQAGMNISCRTPGDQYLLPLKPTLNLLTHPVLPVKEKLALLRLLPDLFYARRHINPGWMTTAADFDEQTLADYIRNKIGPVFLQKFIEPVFRATRSWNPEQVSAAFFISTSAHMQHGSYTFTFKDGIGQFTASLASHADIEYHAEVNEIKRNAETNNCVIHYNVAGIAKEITSDICICAVEGSNVSTLIAEPEPAEENFFKTIKYNSLGIFHAKVKTAEPADITFFSRDHPSQLSIVEINRENNMAKLYCQLSPELSEKVRHEKLTDQLYAVSKNGLRSLFPGLIIDEKTIINQWIAYMLPLFYPGYIKKVAEFHAYQQAKPRRIYYCGDYLSQALVEGACQSGNHVAKTIDEHWSQPG